MDISSTHSFKAALLVIMSNSFTFNIISDCIATKNGFSLPL